MPARLFTHWETRVMAQVTQFLLPTWEIGIEYYAQNIADILGANSSFVFSSTLSFLPVNNKC